MTKKVTLLLFHASCLMLPNPWCTCRCSQHDSSLHLQTAAQHSSTNAASAGLHLEGLNQPRDSGYDKESDASVGSSQLFGSSKLLVPKPLLSAALKTKRDSQVHLEPERFVENTSNSNKECQCDLLEGLNQPHNSDSDESSSSLYPQELFDAPKHMVNQPLLEAALKAKENSSSSLCHDSQGHVSTPGIAEGAQLEGLNQPWSYDTFVSETSLRLSQLFELSNAPISKPFLAAALTAKEDSELKSCLLLISIWVMPVKSLS
jgi:hypothetical protein